MERNGMAEEVVGAPSGLKFSLAVIIGCVRRKKILRRIAAGMRAAALSL
jgi:hypothetical protein